MLYSKSATDPYKTSVIDTIVAEIQSVPGEDRCVLLIGYKDQMEEMFQVTSSPYVLFVPHLTPLPVERQSWTRSTIRDRERVHL
jgi:hypothetical protein